MDWIERWFDVAPDNGDGSLEMMVVVALVASAAILFVGCYGPARRALLRRLGAAPHATKR